MKWPARRLIKQSENVLSPIKSFGMYEVAAELEGKGAELIHLEVGRPSFDTPLHIKEAAKQALDKGIVHYGDLQGSLELRESLTQKLKNYNNIDVQPDEVLITTGLTQASFATFMAAIDEGDEVIVLEPYYPQHNSKIELIGGKVVPVALRREDDYRINSQDIEEKITNKTSMLVFVNPTNPTGRVFTTDEVTAIADIAIKHDLLVMTDEIYEYILYDGRQHISLASLPEMRDRTISVYGFTKAYAMDGWRLGYAAAKKEFIQGIMNIVLNETTHPNVFAQEGAIAATKGSQDCVKEMVAEDMRRRDLVYKRLNEMPNVTCRKPEGSIYAFPDFGAYNTPSEKMAEDILRATHVATESGSFYGATGEGHIRICFGSEVYETLEEALNRIEEYLKKRY